MNSYYNYTDICLFLFSVVCVLFYTPVESIRVGVDRHDDYGESLRISFLLLYGDSFCSEEVFEFVTIDERSEYRCH